MVLVRTKAGNQEQISRILEQYLPKINLEDPKYKRLEIASIIGFMIILFCISLFLAFLIYGPPKKTGF